MVKKTFLATAYLLLFVSIVFIFINIFNESPLDDIDFESVIHIVIYKSNAMNHTPNAYILNNEEREKFIDLINNLSFNEETKPDNRWIGFAPPVLYLDYGDNVTQVSFLKNDKQICVSINGVLYNTDKDNTEILYEYCEGIINDHIFNK